MNKNEQEKKSGEAKKKNAVEERSLLEIIREEDISVPSNKHQDTTKMKTILMKKKI